MLCPCIHRPGRSADLVVEAFQAGAGDVVMSPESERALHAPTDRLGHLLEAVHRGGFGLFTS